MKIGILTDHRFRNYGAFLQAYVPASPVLILEQRKCF